MLNLCSRGRKTVWTGRLHCEGNADELIGTGFLNRGATSWNTTTVPVTPGSTIVILLTVYDSGDGVLDATALVDNWTWITDPDVGPKTVRKESPFVATCTIDDVDHLRGTPSPDNVCRVCRPEVSTSDWSAWPDGTPCPNGTCVDGECSIP